MQKRNLRNLAIIIGVVLVATLIWMNRYQYSTVNEMSVRTNRFTGSMQAFVGAKWKPVKYLTPDGAGAPDGLYARRDPDPKEDLPF
ncbi:MAG: hypothetical protein PHS88_04840 [Candidatus Omnitrophica bacterium]|nr:hypothetical protein [Candidatus Omnitrophota bacterium]